MHHLSPSSRKFRSGSLNPCAACHGAEQAEVVSSAEFCPQQQALASAGSIPPVPSLRSHGGWQGKTSLLDTAWRATGAAGRRREMPPAAACAPPAVGRSEICLHLPGKAGAARTDLAPQSSHSRALQAARPRPPPRSCPSGGRGDPSRPPRCFSWAKANVSTAKA